MQCHMESTKDDLCFSQNIAFVLIKLCLFAFLSLLTSVSNKERLSIYILLSDLLSCEYLLNHILILASFVTLSLVFPGKVSLGGGVPVGNIEVCELFSVLLKIYNAQGTTIAVGDIKTAICSWYITSLTYCMKTFWSPSSECGWKQTSPKPGLSLHS